MQKYYIGSVFTGVVLALASVYLYFQLTLPVQNANFGNIETQYEFIAVDSPIQPIPNVTAVDLTWFQLGKALFHSPLLSSDNSISCASCHLTEYGGDDGFAVSTGVGSKVGSRNSPTVLNAVFNFKQFWDGRSHSLADQVAGPIHNPVEMASNWDEVIGKLEVDADFRYMFSEIGETEITPDAIVKAITIFEEALVTPGAPIDQYLLGDTDALSAQQKRGWKKFQEYGCITCHQGVNIGGNLYQKLGRIDQMPSEFAEDLGLYDVTGNESDRHVFKVPSLRNIAETAPYFHNGSVASLEEAVSIMAEVQLGRQLSLQDKQDLVELLQAFSASYREQR